MGVEITLNTPLADALNAVIQPKLVEIGWSTGGVDDSALSEYIILMLVNGKTQDQIAAELSGDLLNLGPDDPGAIDFANWLFEQVDELNKSPNGGQSESGDQVPKDSDGYSSGLRSSSNDIRDSQGFGHDAEMGDAHLVRSDGSVYVTPSRYLSWRGNARALTQSRPTEPKSMRNGNRNKRLLGHMSKAMDRSNESVLHRVRNQQGTERINGHQREPPKGPRINTSRSQQRTVNGRPIGGMYPAGMPTGGPGAALTSMSPQQQMQLFAMYEEQARMMSQILSPQQQQQMFVGPTFGQAMTMPGYGSGPLPPSPAAGRSLFERVQPRPHGQNGGFTSHQSSRNLGPSDSSRLEQNTNAGAQGPSGLIVDPSSSMEVEGSQEVVESNPATTVCNFNLSCTKEDCPYAHQSPAAPPGTTIDVNDECSFGAACKSRKCVARHPSPAKKMTHQAEQDCKFFPNCTNPACPFRHPTMPLCRHGADCTRPDCKFTHLKATCKYNPCLNPTCPYKHADGQRRGAFDDKVWVADDPQTDSHVSERKFVEDSGREEELIVPESAAPTAKVEAEVAV